MNKIFLLGECMIELMSAHSTATTQAIRAADKTATSKMLHQSFAGDVFNTAVYLKRLFPAIDTQFVTAIGNDNFSDDMLDYFHQHALSTDFVFRNVAKTPGLYAIQLDEYGERSFSYWRSDSAARTLMSFIDDTVTKTITNAICQGDIFFFSGVSLAVILPEDRPKFWSFVQTLKDAGVRIAFDLNYRARLWQSNEEAQLAFKQAFAVADILLPGVDDFAQIFDLKNSMPESTMKSEVEQIIAFFQDYDYQELVIKNGEKNVYCVSGNQQHVVDVTPVSSVVDTTSAGDSFNGAYLGARMAGSSIPQAVALANKVAAFVIQHKGAIVESAAFSSRFN